MSKTSIQWCDFSVNPIRARHIATENVGHYCEKIANGCTNCYSSRMQSRFGTPSFGSGQRRGEYEIFLDRSKLDEVRRRKKPTRYFWEDMSDLFGDWVKQEWLNECFAAMDATPWHTHMLLTKRPQNVRRMWPGRVDVECGDPLDDHGIRGCHNRTPTWPQRHNVWLGCSISDQPTADQYVPELLKCRDLVPVLFLSAEPLLAPICLDRWLVEQGPSWQYSAADDSTGRPGVDWCIAGGESGPHSRPCRIEWIRSLVHQCAVASVPVFCKQLGANVIDRNDSFGGWDTNMWPEDIEPENVEHHIHGFREDYQGADCRVRLRDAKGGEKSEWPPDLRVREFPSLEALPR